MGTKKMCSSEIKAATKGLLVTTTYPYTMALIIYQGAVD